MAAGLAVFFCLISSFLLTGVTSLKCHGCLATRGECRNEDMGLVECGEDQTYCLSYSASITLAGPPLSFTTKSCARAEECIEGYYSITSLEGKYAHGSIYCCQSDGCNVLPLPLPVRDELKPNGYACPGSYTRHGSLLQSIQPVLCLDQEMSCINVNITMKAFGSVQVGASFQGCTTPSTCFYPDGEMLMVNGLLKFSTVKDCNTAPLPVDRAFLPV